MEKKTDSIFDSLWFNIIMSIVSVVMIINHAINQSYILLIIWIIIAYHFIREVMEKK